MNAFKTTVAILGLSIGAVAMDSSVARADECYGAVRLNNPSDVPIHYQIRWGDDSEWEEVCLYPGEWMSHWIELDEYGLAYPPHVRFDCVAGDGRVTWRTYKLDFYATHNTHGGKPHTFRFSPCGTRLNLYRD